jgi:hypothetical protein
VGVLRLSATTMATRPLCFERVRAARPCSQKTSAVRPGATLPSNQPSRETEQTKAVDLPVIPRRFDQALPTPPLARPHAADASDERPPASRLANRGQRVAGARATPAGRREADPTDQPRPDHARGEVRVLWHRLRAPLPAGVSHVMSLRLGFAPSCPDGALADIAMDVQVHADGLFGDLDARLLAQVLGEPSGASSWRCPVPPYGDPARSLAAVRRALAAVTRRSRPGAVRRGTASNPPVKYRLRTRTTVSWLRSTVWAIWLEV